MERLARCLIVAVTLLVTACGGSDSPPPVVSGTASAGKQLTGTVHVKDSAGTVAGPYAIDPQGRFSVRIDDLKAPYLLKAEGYVNRNRVSFYSVANEAGTTNINPMTDLALRMAAGVNSGDPVWDAPASYAASIVPAALAAAAAQVKALVQPFLMANGGSDADPFHDPIQLGKGLDAVFDRVAFQIDKSSGVLKVTSLINGATLATTSVAQIGNAAPLALAGHPSLNTSQPDILSWYGPSGMKFGVGLDSVSKNVAGECVVWDSIKEMGNVQTSYSIDVVQETSQISEALEITTSAHVKVGLYKGSARAATAKSMVKDSNSVYVVVTADVLGYSFNLENARLASPYDQQFSTDWPAFHNRCGDKYLSTVTTGGKFLGFLKITTTSNKEKTAITADIKGKYSGLFNKYSGEASLKSNMDKLTTQYQGEISLFTIGPVEDNPPTDYASFMKSMEEFPSKVNSCLHDYLTCAYQVTFADYLNIGSGKPDIATQQANMDSLIYYSVRYDELLGQIDYIRAQPEAFVNPPDDDALDALSDTIQGDQKPVLDAASACSSDSLKCAIPANVVNPDSVAKQLPKRKEIVPQSCGDYKTNFPNLILDQEYRMYLGGDLGNLYHLYCYDMSSDSPMEYLTLPNYSPPSTSPSYNYATSIADGNDSWTVFTKVRVSVLPGYLTIQGGDYRFSSTTSISKAVQAPFGTSYTSYVGNDWIDNKQGRANLDLTGLPFAVYNPATTWSATGNGLEFTNWIDPKTCGTRPNCGKPVIASPDNRTIQLHISGHSGSVKPAGDLRLVFAK